MKFGNESLITTINTMIVDYENLHQDLKKEINKCKINEVSMLEKCEKRWGN